MSQLSIPAVVRYLQACFSWEYGSHSGLNLLSKSIRSRHFLALETLATGLAAVPLLDTDQRLGIIKALDSNPRSSTLLYGLFPLVVPNGQPGPATGDICAPLFLGQLDRRQLETTDGPALPLRLLVNQVLLAKVVEGDRLDMAVQALQQWIDQRPVAKADVASLLETIRQALPTAQSHGFEIFPLLCSQASLRSALASGPDEKPPILHCAAAIYVAKRSRRSMGVLHELGLMAADSDYSAPLRQLVMGESKSIDANGPLNIIGALSTPQRKAILAARGHCLSVVHGPPGTGKTHLLAMLTADQLANGQSVLICARNDSAVNIIEKFLQTRLQIGGAIVRGGSTQYLRELKARLTTILEQGYIEFATPQAEVVDVCRPETSSEQWPIEKALSRVDHELKQVDRTLSRLVRQIDQEMALGEGSANRYVRLKDWCRWSFGRSKPLLYLDGLMQRWRALHERRAQLVINKLQLRIQSGVVGVARAQRRALAQLARSLTALERNQQRLQAGIDYQLMTRTLPVWITTLADLSHLLPLRKELFDVLIIDEASQADLASALPALQRASRAVIIGDAKQLRHLSFLPRDIEADLLSRHGLRDGQAPGFRDDSILDWANRQLSSSTASSFLDEHFRSAPEIIGFSNQEFYGGRLKLLTHGRRPRGHQALTLVQITGAARNSKDVNSVEAQAVIDRLQQIIVASDDLPPGRKKMAGANSVSIGIISPFRAQADYLQTLVDRQVAPELVLRHRVIVGTAHELQGEERDTVLFSASVDEAAASGSLVFLSRRDVFNVAITRARHQLIVFVSRSPEKFVVDSIFGRYLTWIQSFQDAPSSSVLSIESEFNQAVDQLAQSIDSDRYHITTHCRFGSVQVDLLIRMDGRMLGVDLVGFGGELAFEGLQHHELELMYRMQLPIIPVTRNDWETSSEQVVVRLNRQISDMMESME